VSLKTGQWSGYRKPEHVAAIKKAVADGVPFAKFWTETASKWPEHAHLPAARGATNARPRHKDELSLTNTMLFKRLLSLYTYYAYRERGDARFVNAKQSKPSRYTVEQKALILAYIRDGKTFSSFWREQGEAWKKVSLYRLRNYYRLQQKRYRDMRELDPQLDSGLATLAQTLRPGGASAEVPTQPAKVAKLSDRLSSILGVARDIVVAALRRA